MGQAPVPEQLLEAREKIDEVDRKLVLLLAERFALTARVGELKAKNGLDAVDSNREAQKLESLRAIALKHNLNPDLVASLFTEVMAEVVKNHRRIREAG